MLSQQLVKVDKGTPDTDKVNLFKAKKASSEPNPLFEVLEIEAQPKDTVQSWVAKIRLFVAKKQEAAVEISPIDLANAVKLQDELRSTGLKLRLDWDSDSQTAKLRMPSRTHSRPLAIWLRGILDDLAMSVTKVSCCENQILQIGGDSQIRLKDGSQCDPDASLMIRQNKGGSTVHRHRVLIESMASQNLKDGQRKAERYLTGSKNSVHAVLLLDFKNRPIKSKDNRACKAFIEVWTRRTSNNPAENFPLDMCGLAVDEDSDEEPEDVAESLGKQSGDRPGRGIIEGQEQGGGSKRTHSGLGSDDSSVVGSDVTWDEDTKVDIDPNSLPEVKDSTDKVSPVRLLDTYVVYDETMVEELDDELVLDAYHFVRICRERQSACIPEENRAIKISLKPLREAIKEAVEEDRLELLRSEPSGEKEETEKVKPAKRKAESGGVRDTLNVWGPTKKRRETRSDD